MTDIQSYKVLPTISSTSDNISSIPSMPGVPSLMTACLVGHKQYTFVSLHQIVPSKAVGWEDRKKLATLNVEVDKETGRFTAHLCNFSLEHYPNMFSEAEAARKLTAVMVYDETQKTFHLCARETNKDSPYPLIEVTRDFDTKQIGLAWHHVGVVDQLALCPPNGVPLTIYDPPRQIDNGWSTHLFVEKQSRKIRQYGANNKRAFLIMHRRVRDIRPLHRGDGESLTEDYVNAIVNYMNRTKEHPLGASWYEFSYDPCVSADPDTDSFLVAEFEGSKEIKTNELFVSFSRLYLPLGTRIEYNQVLSSSADDE